MKFPRRSGILLHPTSLPGRYGIGDLGPAAYHFVDWLVEAGQQIWQVLPLGPTGYGDSPYQNFSAFAGNPLLISLDQLIEQGLLTEADLSERPLFPAERVDFGVLIPWKMSILRRAFANFKQSRQDEFEKWVANNEEWLNDYAFFMALKVHFGGGAWTQWPEELRRRDESALAEYRQKVADEIVFQQFIQFQFFQQWIQLHEYAQSQGITIIGDAPIFIAHDSADAWAQRELFYIREDGSLEVQAGVPPDYFSETGQLWGNPLYRWDVMQERGYQWWIDRFRIIFQLVDVVRLDHFRGFEAYWTVPGEAKTAIQGEWRKGPNASLFEAVQDALGTLPIIAEDLGVITPEVEALRDQFDFPGMRILQFAFGADTSNSFLPHNYMQNTAAYTGTHDNETTRGWFGNLDDATRQRVLDYFNCSSEEIIRTMIRALMLSVADTVVVPMQDVLDLNNRARMNLPGTVGGWWTWRASAVQFTPEAAAWLAKWTKLYGRA